MTVTKTKPKYVRAAQIKPLDGIISSDYPKTARYNWKYMQGPPSMSFLLAHEYQRLWRQELTELERRLYPKKINRGHAILDYIQNFSKKFKPKQKIAPKKSFKLKRFENVKSKISSNPRLVTEKK